jgi:alkaline phosphatase D
MKAPWLLSTLFACSASALTLTPQPSANVNRPWPGPDFWTNPAEDWVCREGRIENIFSGGNRNVVILTGEVNDSNAAFTLRARIDQASFDLKDDGFAGFQVGLRTPSGDHRDAAVSGTGLCAGLSFDGSLFIGNTRAPAASTTMPFRNLTLDLRAEPAEAGTYKLILSLTDPSGKKLGGLSAPCDKSWLPGLVSLTASSHAPPAPDINSPRPQAPPPFPRERGGDACFRFDAITLSGDKVSLFPERAFGPILWTTQLPSNDGRIYLLAQTAPFGRQEHLEAVLFLDGQKISSASVEPSSRTARFMVRRSDNDHDRSYEIRLAGASWKGTIRAIPRNRPLTIASLCGDDGSGFPHSDLVANVLAHKPDMITFLGNQIHMESGGYGILVDQHPNERAALCYLRKYMLHGWAWRDALRDIPSVTLPGEQDVFQTRLWGDSGKAADVALGYGTRAQDGGGYMMSPELVNIVHTTQTGNLPPPVDPSPCVSRISVFFTDWTYGPVHFAVINDRQFKSAPKDLLPEANIKNGMPTAESFRSPPPDRPSAQLLGQRQENFLARWAENRGDGSKFHILLSQSPFAAIRTLSKNSPHGTTSETPDDIPAMDFNANAWPATKRNLALQVMKTAGSVHISGGQNLGTTGQYGIKGFGDGPWFIATPPTTNGDPTRWTPASEGASRRPDAPKWTGDFADAFGNQFTLHAVANPHDSGSRTTQPDNGATGYTITTWDPASGHATLANWPCSASPAKPAPDNKPYPGWPVTIDPASGKRVN